MLSYTSVVQLRRFLVRKLSVAKLYAWLLDAEYDSGLDSQERDLLAEVRADALDLEEGRISRFDLDRSVITLLQSVFGGEPGASDVNTASQVRAIWYIYSWDRTSSREFCVGKAGRADAEATFVKSTTLTKVTPESERIVVAAPR